MSYETKQADILRTRQELIVLGVRDCQNHYAQLQQQYMTRTEEIDHADWVKTGVSVSDNDATAPDGELTADTLTFGADTDRIVNTSGVAADGSHLIQSVYLRVASGTQQITMRCGRSGAHSSRVITVTDTWRRYVLMTAAIAAGANIFGQLIRVDASGDDANVMEVWGFNVHKMVGNPVTGDTPNIHPYRKRIEEPVGTVLVNSSRCEAADAGDGNRCYYSRPTCLDPDNFNAGNRWDEFDQYFVHYTASIAAVVTSNITGRGIREYRFCRQGRALAVPGGDVWPMLRKMTSATQEIDPEQSVTVNERMTFEFEDDADPPLWNQRQSVEGALVNTATGNGTFWLRFKAIYRNYSNPECYINRKVGFVEVNGTEDEYETRGRFLIRDVETQSERVKVIAGDRLKLTKEELPKTISDTNVLVAAISDTATTLEVINASELTEPSPAAATSPVYKTIIEVNPGETNAEKMNVITRDKDTDLITVQRARWGTGFQDGPKGTGFAHAAGSPFREVYEFGTERPNQPYLPPLPINPMDAFVEMYRYAGIEGTEIDTSFATERDAWYPSTINTNSNESSGALVRRTVTESTEIEEMITELRALILVMIWVSEDQKIKCKALAPPVPSASPTELTDDANIVEGTVRTDDNDEDRLTRVLIAWDKPPAPPGQTESQGGKPTDFNLVRIEVDVDSEERELYGDKRLRVILTPWLQGITDSIHPRYFTQHIVSRFRHGARRFSGQLEIKDDDLELGSEVMINSRYIQDIHGNNLQSSGVIVMKAPVGDNRIRVSVEETGLAHRYAFYATTGYADYDAATAEQLKRGYLSNARGFLGTPEVAGYYYW